MDAFLLRKAQRYDVKRRKYIKTLLKYYYSDVGLRNARISFRQVEESHLMENVIYNDLIRRGFDVDVGVVEQNIRTDEGKNARRQLEVDFVVNRGGQTLLYPVRSFCRYPREESAGACFPASYSRFIQKDCRGEGLYPALD